MDISNQGRSERNKTIIRRIFEECFNQGNFALADEYVAPSFVGPYGTGPDALRRTARFLRTMFGEARFTIENIIAEDDLVAVRWSMSGAHVGPIFGTTPTGKP